MCGIRFVTTLFIQFTDFPLHVERVEQRDDGVPAVRVVAVVGAELPAAAGRGVRHAAGHGHRPQRRGPLAAAGQEGRVVGGARQIHLLPRPRPRHRGAAPGGHAAAAPTVCGGTRNYMR